MIILSTNSKFRKLHPSFIHCIRLQMAQFPDSQLGVGTGWSGPKTLLDDPRMGPMRGYIQSKLPMPCSVVAWGNYLITGEKIGIHDHADGQNALSGVYYLTDAELQLHPLGKPMEALSFHPGDIIIFPPDTKHSVPPATDLRISIAFNAAPK